MSPIEAVAVALGLANIALIIRRSVWNYPFGIAMVALYFGIFRDAKLYSDAGLQLFFLIVQIYGWVAWLRHPDSDGYVAVERLGRRALLFWIALSLVATAGWGFMMHRLTDASFPWWDASVAMLSVVAQILMTRRAVENWWFWIVVDILSIGLYAAKGLWLTMGLYTVFLVMAAGGLIAWQRRLRAVATA